MTVLTTACCSITTIRRNESLEGEKACWRLLRLGVAC
jgi:hypothetical protein